MGHAIAKDPDVFWHAHVTNAGREDAKEEEAIRHEGGRPMTGLGLKSNHAGFLM